MAEKTKLKWLRKEFSSSEELEYYLTQLKHQDKLKSDIVVLLERFQHLLFQDYEPDSLTITYNGQWDVSFASTNIEEAKQKIAAVNASVPTLKIEPVKEEPTKLDTAKKTAKAIDLATKDSKVESKPNPKEELKNKPLTRNPNKDENKVKFNAKTLKKEEKKNIKSFQNKKGERIDLTDLLNANLLSVGTKLKHKTQVNILGMVTRDGNFKVGKEEYRSLSGAATSLATSGRRDGWLCWLFQDTDGEWKPIDLLRTRWKEKFAGEK